MSQIFLGVINMSISASYIVLAVLFLRLLLKKAPKWITVVLWGIVAVRLICPFSIESVFSLIPSSETVSPEIMVDRTPKINTGIPIVNQIVNPVIGTSFAPNPATSANPLQLWIPTFALLWIIGMAALLIYTVISCVRLKCKIGTAILLCDNIYQSENVVSPFVIGIIKQKIYLPFNMNEKDMGYVVAHEMAHIRRKDHLWKPLGFLLLILHWFNPLMWLGYVLLCRDIELACDEKVIKELDCDARADYSEALLTCSVNRRMIAACPLAFGEVDVKDRVKHIINYKKPAFWLIIAAITACVVVAVCFLTNPTQKQNDHSISPREDIYTDYEGVYITIHSIDKDEDGHNIFNVVWHNETEKEVIFGEMFTIEYKSGEEWLETDFDEERIFFTIGYVLNKNKTQSKSYVAEHSGILKSGTYRFMVPFSVKEGYKYVSYRTWAEFKNIDNFSTIPLAYDSATFDVDGDGVDENCSMRYGTTSGLFTFIFLIQDKSTGEIEYETTIYSQVYDLSFVKGEDGITKVKAVTRDETPKTHLFDISIKNGYVNLTENGVSIGEVN